MKRPVFLIVLMILLAGCASREPLARDAFFGRTAIVPPGTGSFAPPPAPYYQPTKQLSAAPTGEPGRSGTTVARNSAASWKRAGSANEPSDGGTVVRSALHTAESRPTTAMHKSQVRDDRSPPIASRWSADPAGTSTVRTRVYPPDYASKAPNRLPEVDDLERLARDATSATVASADERNAAAPSRRERVVRVIQPRASATDRQPARVSQAPQESATTRPASAFSWAGGDATRQPSPTPVAAPTRATGRTPRQITFPNHVTELADLPDPGSRSRRRVDTRVRPASATLVSRTPLAGTGPREPVPQASRIPTNSAVRERSSSPPPLRYGHDPAYGWLRGRLEYSQVAKRWKLRYIPIDGETDRYGGSVVLGESSLLADQNQGDFVEVRGRLQTGENGDWGYAPVYTVAQVRPLGK